MATARLAAGITLNDRYQIDEFVGVRAYGEVYRGRDLSDGKIVTIQALSPQLLADPKVRARLEKEIQVALQLDHKNVGATYGLFGAMVGSDAVAYLASEFIDGQTLREMIDKKRASGRTFSLKGTYNVVAHLCNALIYAHGATVHGGLSPESVLVNSAGRVKVTDFGLARALRANDPAAQAAMAPEMASAPERADARADLYSVGAILFELLCGRAPGESFERPSTVVAGVPPSVDAIVEACLSPQPEHRYPDAQSLKDALHSTLAGELDSPAANAGSPVAPAPARPAAPPPAVKRPPSQPAVSSAPPPSPNRPATPAPISSAPRPPAPAAPTMKAAPMPQPKGPAIVPKSFNVDSALSATDDQTERWLIQKDKLDFGPFNMRDVRSQIEGGKILGEHTIIDSENGERRKVKDHPQLRQIVMEAEAKNAEAQRVAMEDAERRKQRGKVVTILGVIMIIVLGVGGGVSYYVFKVMKPKVIKEVVHDGADLDFLKGLEITMKVDPPAAKPKTSGHRVKKPGSNEFSDVTNLGDASEGGGDETLDQSVVQRVMTQNFKVLVGCISEERRRNAGLHAVDMDFIIKGTGNVSAVKVNGQTGTQLANCMFGKMQTVMFPKFNGNKTHAAFSLNLK